MYQVAKFLGINYSPAFLNPSIFGEPVITRTASVQTNKVFRVERNWYEDLTFFEILVVWVAYKALCIALRLVRRRKGRILLSYSEIRENVLRMLSAT